MSSRAITRKRSRAQFNEVDELASDIEKTPLSNAKRKKSNVTAPSSGHGTVFGSIRKSLGGIGGLLGFREQGKENASAEDEDELADNEVSTPSRRKPVKDIFDVPSSPEEERRILGRRGGSASSLKKVDSTKGKGSTNKQRGSKASVEEPVADIYDVPEDEPTPKQGKKYGNTVERAKAHLAPVVQQSSLDTPKRKPGRPPRKSEILKQAKQLSNKAAREKMMADQQKEAEEEESAETPSRRESRRTKREGSVESPQPGAVSTARKSGKSARDKLLVPEPEKELKSALTPSKHGRGRGRPRKSVAFEDVEDVDLGFKDLPDSASANKANKSKLVEVAPSAIPDNEESNLSAVAAAEETSGSDEDDVACARCSGLDSEKSNPIILCDKCDSGLHLKCSKLNKLPKGSWLCPSCAPKPKADDLYCRICSRPDSTKRNQIILCETCDYGIHLDCSGMDEIPEGEWFCPECKPESGRDLPSKPGSLLETSSKFPDIEGFETHLRCMQRVLLDKLTGQKRIKPMGHDDEMQKVYQVVEQTVLAGEGNSMLVIGARGVGKTAVS